MRYYWKCVFAYIVLYVVIRIADIVYSNIMEVRESDKTMTAILAVALILFMGIEDIIKEIRKQKQGDVN